MQQSVWPGKEIYEAMSCISRSLLVLLQSPAYLASPSLCSFSLLQAMRPQTPPPSRASTEQVLARCSTRSCLEEQRARTRVAIKDGRGCPPTSRQINPGEYRGTRYFFPRRDSRCLRTALSLDQSTAGGPPCRRGDRGSPWTGAGDQSRPPQRGVGCVRELCVPRTVQ